MAGRLSFSIAINLLTENFKRGTNSVKNGLRVMQMQVLTFAAALGAGGLGLSNFVSRLIDVARETSRVTNALKNVSGSMAQLADNQRFLLDMAKKYGIEINALTGNYAKFTAAASISGMSMMDQRKIFESVSRAVTAFGMSAEDSNGVFLALSQMMSKGKVSSEELRLQMGERLPIALQAMAKAAGVSVGGLDKLLKQGKLMSKDVLPKFAEALDKMIPNVDTDNLETSVNRLKNAFTEFVNGTEVQSKYKALIDWLTNAVKVAADNIRSVITYTVAAIMVMVTSRLVNKILLSISRAELAAKSAARRAAKDAGRKFDEIAWKAQRTSASIKMAFSKAAMSIRATLISMVPTAILTVIGAVVAKLYDAYREAKRIKGLFDEYQKRMNDVSSKTPEIIKIRALQEEYNKTNATLSDKKRILAQINGILGTELSVNQDVNKVIEKRISLLESAARAELAAKEVADSENELRKIGSKSYNGKTIQSMAPDWAAARGDRKKEERFKQKYGITSGIDEISFKFGNFRNDLDSFIEHAKILKDAKGRLGKEIANSVATADSTPPEPDSKKTELQKAEEKYAKSLRELDARREVEKMSESEYYKAVDELGRKMLIEAKASGDKEILNSKYLKMLQDVIDHPLYDEVAAEMEKVQKEYNDKVKENKTLLSKGLISQKAFNENLVGLSVEAAKSAASIKGIGKRADAFIKDMLDQAISHIPSVKMKSRDTTFDYKKSKVDIASENLDKAKEYAKELQEQAKKVGKELSDELSNAIANVPTLEEALKLAKVKEDVKNFTKELDESLYSGIKDIATSSDRVVSAFTSLRDVMNDVDATGWEKIMAIWNAMINTVDSFTSIVRTIENISVLAKKLAGAKEAQQGLEESTAGTVAGTVVKIAADEVATKMELENSQKKSAAAVTEMASKSTAAYAGIPFVGVALAAGQIATMMAMIETARISAPGFNSGGIYLGGASFGDKGLARLNKGEMILNMTQQSNLFDAINSGNLGSSNRVQIEFGKAKVLGSDILLSINNTLKKQGKKPLWATD